jgi:hypothetical protein
LRRRRGPTFCWRPPRAFRSPKEPPRRRWP